jgi:hypothetical protein
MDEKQPTLEEPLGTEHPDESLHDKGHYKLLPLQPGAYVRLQRWLPDP